MIEVIEARKNYGSIQALDQFSLKVEEGEVLGLVGPNGAGKTTLIKILATLARPDGGSVKIGGHDLACEAAKIRALVGYLQDIPGVYTDTRIMEFLDFFAEAFQLRGPSRREAVERALQRAGLEDRRADFVEDLSLGQKQRLLLAKTLLHRPKVLLLDEPATGLDPIARSDLRNFIKRLRNDGITILISSHILSDLEEICDRVALIDSGRNALDSSGRSILTVGGPQSSLITYEIEVIGDIQPTLQALGRCPDAKFLESHTQTLLIEIQGGPDKAVDVLRQLVINHGVPLVRFGPHGKNLEQRYRQAFGGRRNESDDS